MPGQITRRVSPRTGAVSWRVQLLIGHRPGGRPKYLIKTFGRLKDAKEYRAKILQERDSGTLVEPSKMTLDEYLDKWLETAVKPRVRANTFESYRWQLAKYVRLHLGDHRLDAITPMVIQNLYTRLLATKAAHGNKKKENDPDTPTLSHRVVRYTHTILSNALAQAVRWRMLARNPAEMAELPKRQRREMQALTPDQAKAFLAALDEERYGLVFKIALLSAMRPSEYLALRWDDIDHEDASISVCRSLVRIGASWSFAEPKTDKARRKIPLPKVLIQELREHKAKQGEQRLAAGAAWRNHGLVFCNEVGEPLDRTHLDRCHFRRILRKAGLPSSLRLYDLRHSCATLLLKSGVHPKVAQERLGHSSVTLTLDTYSHVLDGMQEDATRKLEELLLS